MTSPDEAAAEKVVLDFMAAMCAWEKGILAEMATFGRGYFDTNADSFRQSLAGIYATFLTPKDRKNGRMASLSVGTPLEFDPDQEPIVATVVVVPGKKVVVETLRSAVLKVQRRYTVVSSKGEWRIDKREDFSAFKEKWASGLL